MRRVVGRSTVELSGDDFAVLAARHPDGLVLDLGTGDGKHVVSLARSRPGTLVVGLDAGPDAMRRSAYRAAQRPQKGGVANALFVWASVEQLPRELGGLTDVHVLMPWGSLLRALVEPDAAVLRAVAAACRPGAAFVITLNLHAWRPAVAEVGGTAEPTPESVHGSIAATYLACGWRVDDAHYATDSEVAALGTSWTKRLGSTRDDLAVLYLAGVIDPTGAGRAQPSPPGA